MTLVGRRLNSSSLTVIEEKESFTVKITFLAKRYLSLNQKRLLGGTNILCERILDA